jgi:hypothetical protein
MGPRRGAWARSLWARVESSQGGGNGTRTRTPDVPSSARGAIGHGGNTPRQSWLRTRGSAGGLKSPGPPAYSWGVSPLLAAPMILVQHAWGGGPRAGEPLSIWIYLGGAVLVGLAVLCLRAGLWRLRRRRLLSDLPTTPAASVFIGLVEVEGTAESPAPLTSMMVAKPCVLFHTIAEEHYTRTRVVTETDSDGNTRTRTETDTGWELVGSVKRSQPFFVKDSSGAVRVDPDGAKLDLIPWYSEEFGRRDPEYGLLGANKRVSGSDGRRRYRELGIPLHTELYVVGRAREREDAVAAEIASDPDAVIFRITHRGEAAISRAHAWGGLGFFILGALLHAGAVAIFFGRHTPQAIALAGAAYPLVWLLGYGVSLRNGLVDLRDRCDRALSRLDIEYQRRTTLIPRLIAAVEGSRQHEREVQALVAELRAQADPGNDQLRGLSPRLRALAEDYPELSASADFAQLHAELVHTENRIAWVRGYLNSIHSAFNERLERVPDRFIAGPLGFARRPLLTTDDFERVMPEVDFADEAESA